MVGWLSVVGFLVRNPVSVPAYNPSPGNGRHHAHERRQHRSPAAEDDKASTSEISSRAGSTSLSESEDVFFDAPANFTPMRKKHAPFRLPVMSPFEEESFKAAKMALQFRQAGEKLPNVAANLKKLDAAMRKCEDLVFHIREESSLKDEVLKKGKKLLAVLSSLLVLALVIKGVSWWRRRLTVS